MWRVVRLQDHLHLLVMLWLRRVICWNKWQIFRLGQNNDSHLPPGTLRFSFKQHHKQPPPSQTFSDLHKQTNDPSQKPTVLSDRRRSDCFSLISGVRMFQLDSLCHLPGAVQRHSHPHCGHRHGNGVDEAALWLHPDLPWDLPLQIRGHETFLFHIKATMCIIRVSFSSWSCECVGLVFSLLATLLVWPCQSGCNFQVQSQVSNISTPTGWVVTKFYITDIHVLDSGIIVKK